MKTLLASAAATLVALPALASGIDPCAINPNATGCSTPIPEISALEGTAALAAVAAIVLLAWERRRRAL